MFSIVAYGKIITVNRMLSAFQHCMTEEEQKSYHLQSILISNNEQHKKFTDKLLQVCKDEIEENRRKQGETK